MLAAIHHNSNIDAELSGERQVLRETERISRANTAPSKRVHKTLITKWQLEIMSSLKNLGVDDEVDEIAEELEDIMLEDIGEDGDFEAHWNGFFNDHVYI